MLCRAAVALCMFLTLPLLARAQSDTPENKPAATPPAVSSPSGEPSDSPAMEEPMVGDHWTYEVHDEITGTLRNTSTETITDMTPTEISLRTELVGGAGATYFVYDRLWNMKNSATWKYVPNDGAGVKLPLKVGSTWKAQDTALFGGRSTTERRSVSSRVVGEETITTDAGTFHAFKIETSVLARNIHDPTKKSEATMTSWYAPAIDHWVKRIVKVDANGHVTQNISVVLVDCGRR